MRYVHFKPRYEAADRLGRHLTGAAAELDASRDDPETVRTSDAPEPSRPDSGRPEKMNVAVCRRSRGPLARIHRSGG
jgi:hypothetical protein